MAIMSIGLLSAEETDVPYSYDVYPFPEYVTETDTLDVDVAEEWELPEENLFDRPQEERRREINFTLADVVEFCTNDKESINSRENLYRVPYYNKLKINNFWLLRPQLPFHLYQRKLNNFGHWNNNKFFMQRYPYAPAITRLHAGIGQFDRDFAHITLMKDEFLTINNLNFRGDFRASNALSVDNIDNNYGSSNFYFQSDYRLNDFAFSAVFINTSQNTHSRYYSFQDAFNNNTELMSDKWSFYSFEVAWRNFFVGSMISTNALNSSATNSSIKFEEQAYVAGTQFNWNHQDLKLSYQRSYYRFENATKTSNDDNIFYINHRISGNRFSLETDLLFFDNFSKNDISNQLSVNFYRNFHFLSDVQRFNNHRSNVRYMVETKQRSVYKAGIGHVTPDRRHYSVISERGKRPSFSNPFQQHSHSYWRWSIDFMLGQKHIDQVVRTPMFYRLDERFWTFSSNFYTAFRIDRFTAQINNYFEYDYMTENFLLLPEYSNITDLSLSWFLPSDNRVSIGSRINVLSDVIVEHGRLFSFNPVVDVYFSFGITKLFDIKVELNNIYRNMYFGNNVLHDFHVTSYLVWYFIN